VTGGSFGDRVVLLTVGIEDPFPQQPGKPASELRPPSVEVVGPELVEGNGDHEARLRRDRLLCREK
jgi:hypothetical protein